MGMGTLSCLQRMAMEREFLIGVRDHNDVTSFFSLSSSEDAGGREGRGEEPLSLCHTFLMIIMIP